MSPLYPVNVDLGGRRVLLVGAGPVGARKLDGLLTAGARVTVVAPEAVDEIAARAEAGVVRWHRRPYQRGEVASYRLAITTTGVVDVDGQVHADAVAAGVLVNSADDPPRCDFTLPAVVRHGDLTLTVSTGGRSPAVAAWVRRRLESEADQWAALVAAAGEVRDEVRSTLGTSEIPGWSAAIEEAAAVIRARLGVVDPVTAGARP